MACNIDAKGRGLRLVLGTLTLAAAVLVAAAGLWGGWWYWITAAALAGLGSFMVYEGRRGWCVIRAMGFRTPI